MRFLKTITENTFYRILSRVLIPAVVLVIFLAVVISVYNAQYKETLKDSYLTGLEAVSTHNESSMQNMAKIMDILNVDETFMNVAQGIDTDPSDISYVEDIFNQIKLDNEIIDSIVLVERISKNVYGTIGTQKMRDFFESSYVYDGYDYEYWDTYQAFFSQRHILPPCQVTKSDNMKYNIIPIVFNKIDNKQFGNIIIVNIKLSELTVGVGGTELSEHCEVKMFSLSKQKMYSIDEATEEDVNSDFAAQILSTQKNTFDYNMYGKKSLILSYRSRRTALGYAYVAIVPYSDIYHIAYKLLAAILLIGIITVGLAILAAVISSRSIFTPIKDLVTVFSGDSRVKQKNLIKALHGLIDEAVTTNKKMKKEKLITLPLLQEFYLINLLNSNSTDNLDMMKIEFEYNWFCSIVMQLRPTKFFYENFSSVEHDTIRKGIHDLIKDSFAKLYKTYIILSEINTIYVLLNLRDDSEMDNIERIANLFKDALKHDEDYMKCTIGIGKIYEGIDGLQQSHNEALASVNGGAEFAQLQISTRAMNAKNTFQFTITEGNELYNSLFVNRIEEAISLIDGIVKKNIKRNISQSALKELYHQFFNVVFNVMRARKISYDEQNVGNIALIDELTTGTIDQINNNLMRTIRMLEPVNGQNVKFSTIIEYIRKHFSEDLHLELLSEQFGISSKYLSKRLKEELGVNFVDYLTTLRINKAIEELKTNKSITEIYNDVGFNNRNTFNRLFKTKTGVTPSEYRKRMQR